MKAHLVIAATLLGACGHEPPPPGIIVVSIDTLRADAVTGYGAGSQATPSLARLAQEGTVFERVFAQSNETLFSHASLFTSQLPSHLAPVDYDLTIPDGTPTMAGALADAGWRTGAIVAGGHLARVFGLDDGFGEYVEARRWGSFQETVPMALRWLDQAAAGPEPFLLFVHSYDCHAPYTKPHVLGRSATPGYDGPLLDRVHDSLTYERMYGSAFLPGFPLWQLTNTRGTRILTPTTHTSLPAWAARTDVQKIPFTAEDEAFLRGLYATGAFYADLWVGVLLDELHRRGLDETTTLVVLSDHGEGLLDHGFYNHRNTLHDAATQVPLIIRPAGGQAAPARVRDVAQLLDVAPTVLELADVPAPATMRGRSLAGCIDGGACTTGGVAYSEGVLDVLSVTDGAFRLTLEGTPASDPTVDAHLKDLSPTFAKLWDTTGSPGGERALSLTGADPEVVGRLVNGALAIRGSR